MTDATVESFPLYVKYHCDAGLSFGDGQVSPMVECPCGQTWDYVLSGRSCQGTIHNIHSSRHAITFTIILPVHTCTVFPRV